MSGLLEHSTVGARILTVLRSVMPVPDDLVRQIENLPDDARSAQADETVARIARMVLLFAGDDHLRILRELDASSTGQFAFFPRNTTVPIEDEGSVALSRREARTIAIKLGFDTVPRTKIATATSELARNIQRYAGRGTVHLKIVPPPGPFALIVDAIDHGPGIRDVEAVLSSKYRSATGMGLGLRGVRAIADEFDIHSVPGDRTRVRAAFHTRRRDNPVL